MYILKDKQTNNYTIVTEKQTLANLLGIHRNTLNNRLELNKTIESEKYLLIIPFKYYPPTKNKGNRDSFNQKRSKNDDNWA
jgi:hypothetical protein